MLPSEVVVSPNEYYLRDHTGKELAVYDLNNSGRLKSLNLYGNGLIGKVNVTWDSVLIEIDPGNFQWVYNRTDDRYYYIKDHLGSIRVTINSAGEIVSAQDYYAYGEVLRGYTTSLDPNKRFLFTEKERDVESGYDYFGARYYDSDIARWTTIDPLWEIYYDLSPYTYCTGNPTIYIDVNGEFIGTAIGAVVGAAAGAYNSYKKGGDVLAGAAEGAVAGAITGAVIDLAVTATVATGGGALVVIGVGAAAGAIGGAAGAVAGDATGQIITSLNEGSSLSDAVNNVNTTNMGDKAKTGAITGAIGGTTGGAVGKCLQVANNTTRTVQETMSKNIIETTKVLTKMGANEKTVDIAVNKITTGMVEAGRNTVNTTNKVAAGINLVTESSIQTGKVIREKRNP